MTRPFTTCLHRILVGCQAAYFHGNSGILNRKLWSVNGTLRLLLNSSLRQNNENNKIFIHNKHNVLYPVEKKGDYKMLTHLKTYLITYLYPGSH